jgi:hypothetical protein
MAGNLETLKALYGAFAKGDVPAVLGMMDEKIEWREPASLPFEDQIGPGAVAENIFGPVVQQIADFSVTPEEYLGDGDTIVALGRYGGKGAKNGVALDTPFAHRWTFRGGKVASFYTYTDTKAWLDTLGA